MSTAPNRTIDAMIGRTYLERGRPVVVLIRWSGRGPRNVLIQRATGERVVRPFRGLRRPSSDLAARPACDEARSPQPAAGTRKAP